MIGKGSFGFVFTGLNCDTGELLAVKEFRFSGTVEVIKEVLFLPFLFPVFSHWFFCFFSRASFFFIQGPPSCAL